MEQPKNHFVLRGFSQVRGCRVFSFEGMSPNRTGIMFSVRADLAMSRRYGIHLQELPLLCRAVLERRHLGGEQRNYAYTEAEMRDYAVDAAARAEAAKQRRPPKRPVSDQVGAAWRAPQPLLPQK